MPTQSHQDKIAAAAERRRQAIIDADKARSTALMLANRTFVREITPSINDRALTVIEVAEISKLNRGRIYQLMRQYVDHHHQEDQT